MSSRYLRSLVVTLLVGVAGLAACAADAGCLQEGTADIFGSTGKFSTPEEALASVLAGTGTTAAEYQRVDVGEGRVDYRYTGDAVGAHRYELAQRDGQWEVQARLGCQDNAASFPA